MTMNHCKHINLDYNTLHYNYECVDLTVILILVQACGMQASIFFQFHFSSSTFSATMRTKRKKWKKDRVKHVIFAGDNNQQNRCHFEWKCNCSLTWFTALCQSYDVIYQIFEIKFYFYRTMNFIYALCLSLNFICLSNYKFLIQIHGNLIWLDLSDEQFHRTMMIRS